MTASDEELSWNPRPARRLRVEHGLTLIDAAARACAVFDRRWLSPTGERAVAVTISRTRWLVYPVDTGWVAVQRDRAGQPDVSRTVWLQRAAGELRIPTAAWGRLLSGAEVVPGDAPTAEPTTTPLAPVAPANRDAHDRRRHVERRVLAARREAVAWVRSPANASRIDDVPLPLTPFTLDRSLAEYRQVFDTWGVPGLAAPDDLGDDLASRWARSVTLAVLRELGRRGAASRPPRGA